VVHRHSVVQSIPSFRCGRRPSGRRPLGRRLAGFAACTQLGGDSKTTIDRGPTVSACATVTFRAGSKVSQTTSHRRAERSAGTAKVNGSHHALINTRKSLSTIGVPSAPHGVAEASVPLGLQRQKPADVVAVHAADIRWLRDELHLRHHRILADGVEERRKRFQVTIFPAEGLARDRTGNRRRPSRRPSSGANP
jgi:hypothetical protein